MSTENETDDFATSEDMSLSDGAKLAEQFRLLHGEQFLMAGLMKESDAHFDITNKDFDDFLVLVGAIDKSPWDLPDNSAERSGLIQSRNQLRRVLNISARNGSGGSPPFVIEVPTSDGYGFVKSAGGIKRTSPDAPLTVKLMPMVATKGNLLSAGKVFGYLKNEARRLRRLKFDIERPDSGVSEAAKAAFNAGFNSITDAHFNAQMIVANAVRNHEAKMHEAIMQSMGLTGVADEIFGKPKPKALGNSKAKPKAIERHPI